MKLRLSRRVAASVTAAALVAGASLGLAQPTGAGSSQSDRVLRVVTTVEPASLNPLNLSQSTGVVWGPMMEAGLIALDADFRPTGEGLIAAWERTEPTTWRFTLREGVSFHNGEPFDAAAVKFSIETYQAAEASPMRPYTLGITEIVAVDELTLDVTTESPDLSIPAVFTALRALPPVHYTEVGETAFGQAPVGVGPFVFKEWSPGNFVEMTANPDYWRGPPGVAGIRISFAGDGATRASLLQSHEADLALAIPVQLREELRNGEGTTTVESATRSQLVLFQIDNREQLADPNLRTAVQKSVDRNLIVEAILEGEGGAAAASLLAPLYFEPPTVEIPEPDHEGAAALIEAAGGAQVTLTFAPAQTASGDAVAEAIAGMLEESGFEVTRNPLDFAQLNADFIGGNLDGLVLYPILPVFPHPKVFVQGFLTSNSITKGCSTPGVDELNQQAIAAEDEATSDELYHQIEDAAIFTDGCLVPIYYEVQSWGLAADVTGFTPPSATIIDYFPISFDD